MVGRRDGGWEGWGEWGIGDVFVCQMTNRYNREMGKIGQTQEEGERGVDETE